MISATINGKPAVLSENTRLQLVLNNPFFNTETIIGDYSLTLGFPFCPLNDEIFSFAVQPNAKFPFQTFDVEVFFGNNASVISGVFVLRDTINSYNGNMRLNLTQFTCFQKKLNEIDYGLPATFFSTADLIAHINDTVVTGNGKYTFPVIINPDFYDGKNPDALDIMNAWNFMTQSAFENPSGQNKYFYSPQLFFSFIIQRAFAGDGYTVEGSFIDNIASHLLIYNNRALDKFGDIPAIGGMKAQCTSVQVIGTQDTFTTIIFNDDSTNGNYDDPGTYDNTTGKITVPSAGGMRIAAPLTIAVLGATPAGSVTVVTARIMKNSTVLKSVTVNVPHGQSTVQVDIPETAFTMSSGDIGSEIYVEIYFSNALRKWGMSLHINNNSFFRNNDGNDNSQQNVFDPVIAHANHVPDMTFGELLNEMRKVFFFAISVDETRKRVVLNCFNDYYQQFPETLQKIFRGTQRRAVETAIKNIAYQFGSDDQLVQDNFLVFDSTVQILDPVSTLAGLPSPSSINKLVLVQNENKFYISYDNSGSLEWKVAADNYYPLVIDNNETVEVVVAGGPVFMKTFGDRLMPYIKQVGSSPCFGIGINPASLRFMWWHGMQEGFGGYLYPFASSGNLDIDGNELAFFPLSFNVPAGPVELLGQPLLRMLAGNVEYIDAFQADINSVKNINPLRPIGYNQNVFMARQIIYELTGKGFLPAQIIAMKLDGNPT